MDDAAQPGRAPLNAKQAAAALGIHRSTLVRKAAAGEIRCLKLPGETGAYLFDPDYIASLTSSSDTAA